MARQALETQTLSRSVNEALILVTLVDAPRHGYEIALEIARRGSGYFNFRHGTLYPILHQLEHDGLIKGSWSEEGPRGRRKLYALTRKGRRRIEEQRVAWRDFAAHFFAAVGLEAP